MDISGVDIDWNGVDTAVETITRDISAETITCEERDAGTKLKLLVATKLKLQVCVHLVLILAITAYANVSTSTGSLKYGSFTRSSSRQVSYLRCISPEFSTAC